MHSIFNFLSDTDEETDKLEELINQTFLSGQSVADAVHSFFNRDSSNESSIPVPNANDRACTRQTGDEPQTLGRISKGWFGDGSGI